MYIKLKLKTKNSCEAECLFYAVPKVPTHHLTVDYNQLGKISSVVSDFHLSLHLAKSAGFLPTPYSITSFTQKTTETPFLKNALKVH